ncbi:MAG: twin-arginine translocase TatA/TatE family subunit [Lawsonibacter sp.]
MGKIGTQELLIILCIALLIFGPKKLPQLGKALGQTITNFKKGSKKAEKEGPSEEAKV